MRILVIHQNFPAQFYHLVGALARRGHDVVALGSCEQASLPEGVIYGVYSVNEPDENLAYHDRSLELALRRARKVRGACEQLRDSGWIADVVLFHCSWGEGLYLRDVWPDQRLVGYPELYGSQLALGYGFDKTLSSPPPLLCEGIRHINLLSLAAIADSDAMICPTFHQRDSFPSYLRQQFHVTHEGVNLQALSPNPERCLVMQDGNLALRPGDPVVTYCSRHLEPLRGFQTFMRSLPRLQALHPTVQVLIVGENSKGYGLESEHADGYLGEMMEELSGTIDLTRIHLLGRVSYEQLIGIFQVSAAHVYLTYPYVLSWSLLEAMACGAPVVGSRCAPVQEVIEHDQNGLLVDFNNDEQLSDHLLMLLDDKVLRARLGAAARATIEQSYGLEACTDAYEAILSGVASP